MSTGRLCLKKEKKRKATKKPLVCTFMTCRYEGNECMLLAYCSCFHMHSRWYSEDGNCKSFSGTGLFIIPSTHTHTHTFSHNLNATPLSYAKHYDAKPEVLGAQVPHSTVPGARLCFFLPSIFLFLMQNLVHPENGQLLGLARFDIAFDSHNM